MKKLFILTLALLFLLTGCTQSPPPETQASDPTITTASEPIIIADPSPYAAFSMDDFLRDLALVREDATSDILSVQCLQFAKTDFSIWIPETLQELYVLDVIQIYEDSDICYWYILKADTGSEDSQSLPMEIRICISPEANDPDYTPFPDGTLAKEDTYGWWIDLGDRYALVQCISIDNNAKIESAEQLLSLFAFTAYTSEDLSK